MKRAGDVTVRVDANSVIGLGHLRRCEILLEQLQYDGFKVRLVGRYRFGNVIESLIEKIPIVWLEDTELAINHRVELEDEMWDAAGTLSIIGRHPTRVSWVIVDHYSLGEEWERIVRDAGHRILAIDDFRNRSHFADILVSDTIVPFNPTLNKCLGNVRELVGLKYALVGTEFAFSAKTSFSVESKKQILISYGGSDPTNETIKALEAIKLLRNNELYSEWLGGVDVVVGQANARTDEITQFASKVRGVIVHVAPRSLAPLMRRSDLILTAGGNSMIEGLTMRKPCLITLTSDNQSLMVAYLLERQAIRSLGIHDIVGPSDIVKSIIDLLYEYELFANYLKGQSIFDHYGAHRISEVVQLMSRDAVVV